MIPSHRERGKYLERTRTRRKTGDTAEPVNRNHSVNGDDDDGGGKRHASHASQSHGNVGEAFRERGEERAGDSEESYYSQSSSQAPSSFVGSRKARPLNYAERLHRGGEEQRQLRAKRWARLFRHPRVESRTPIIFCTCLLCFSNSVNCVGRKCNTNQPAIP